MMDNLRRLVRASALALVLAACSTSNEPPLTQLPYSEDFSNPNSGWTTSADLSGDTQYATGQMRILVKTENISIWSVSGKSFRDVIYEVDAQPVGGPQDNGYGVLFRYKDRKNFYHFEVSSDGYWRAGIMKEGKMDNWADWQQHPAIKTNNEVNRIKIQMKGEQLTYFVNDKEIYTRTDKELLRGDLGVFALTSPDRPNVEIAFDNVTVVATPP